MVCWFFMPVVLNDEIVWKGCKYSIEVFDDKHFEGLTNVTQVYGFIFDDVGKILIIRTKGGEWSLPGGGPESYDSDWKATLIREVDEEANVDIKDIKPAGYISSKALGKEFKLKQGIALRVIGRVEKIKERAPDPATGSVNERKFVDKNEFLKYCSWGENGKAQLKIALDELKKSS